MKTTRELHIQFNSIDELFSDIKNTLQTGKPDEFAGKEVRFEDYTKFMNFLFPHKFALLVAIKVEKPRSIYQLAQLVDRHQNVVLKDCDDLRALGFIDYDKGERNSSIPRLTFDYDTIVVHAPKATQSFHFSEAA